MLTSRLRASRPWRGRAARTETVHESPTETERAPAPVAHQPALGRDVFAPGAAREGHEDKYSKQQDELCDAQALLQDHLRTRLAGNSDGMKGMVLTSSARWSTLESSSRCSFSSLRVCFSSSTTDR